MISDLAIGWIYGMASMMAILVFGKLLFPDRIFPNNQQEEEDEREDKNVE